MAGCGIKNEKERLFTARFESTSTRFVIISGPNWNLRTYGAIQCGIKGIGYWLIQNIKDVADIWTVIVQLIIQLFIFVSKITAETKTHLW